VKCIVNNQIVLSKPLEGPLSGHIASFAQSASDQGYASYSIYRRVLLAACFSRWLGKKAVQLQTVSSELAARFLQNRAQRVQLARGDSAILGQLILLSNIFHVCIFTTDSYGFLLFSKFLVVSHAYLFRQSGAVQVRHLRL